MFRQTLNIFLAFILCFAPPAICRAQARIVEKGIRLEIPGNHIVRPGDNLTLSFTTTGKFKSQEWRAQIIPRILECFDDISHKDLPSEFLFKGKKTVSCTVSNFTDSGKVNLSIFGYNGDPLHVINSNEVSLTIEPGLQPKPIDPKLLTKIALKIAGNHIVHPGDVLALSIDVSGKNASEMMDVMVLSEIGICINEHRRDDDNEKFDLKIHKTFSCKVPEEAMPGRWVVGIIGWKKDNKKDENKVMFESNGVYLLVQE